MSIRTLFPVALAAVGPAAVIGAFAVAGAVPAHAVARSTATSSMATPAGWKLVATDEFTESQLGSQWGTYGGTYGIGASAWSAGEVSVGGGVLRVRVEHKTTAGKPYTSGGAAMWGLTQTYGRYEFQAMAPTTPGIDSYITLWPKDDSDTDSMLVELLAKPAVAPGLQAAYVTVNYGSGTAQGTFPGAYCGAFHDYVIEWTPTYESVTVDGKLLLKSPSSTRKARWIGFITSNGDNLTGTPGPGDPLPAEFDVRHLRVYAYSPGAPASSSTSTSPSPSRAPTTSGSRTPASVPTTATTAPRSSTAGARPAATASSGPSPATTASVRGAAVAMSTNRSGPGTGVLVAGASAIAAVLGSAAVVVRRRTRRPGAHRGR
jgi:hypothetical protein